MYRTELCKSEMACPDCTKKLYCTLDPERQVVYLDCYRCGSAFLIRSDGDSLHFVKATKPHGCMRTPRFQSKDQWRLAGQQAIDSIRMGLCPDTIAEALQMNHTELLFLICDVMRYG